MMNIRHLPGQAVALAAFAVLLGYFAHYPRYADSPAGMAQIKISFAIAGEPKGACRTLTDEDRAHLAPNMRRARVCPRERVPVALEIDIDGHRAISRILPPTGLQKDGAAIVYETLTVTPGQKTISMRVRLTARESGFDYVQEKVVDLDAGRNLAIDFMADAGGFVVY